LGKPFLLEEDHDYAWSFATPTPLSVLVRRLLTTTLLSSTGVCSMDADTGSSDGEGPVSPSPLSPTASLQAPAAGPPSEQDRVLLKIIILGGSNVSLVVSAWL